GTAKLVSGLDTRNLDESPERLRVVSDRPDDQITRQLHITGCTPRRSEWQQVVGNQLAGKGLTCSRGALEPAARALTVFPRPLREQARQRVRCVRVGLLRSGTQPSLSVRARYFGAKTICVDETKKVFGLHVTALGAGLQLTERGGELFRPQRNSSR